MLDEFREISHLVEIVWMIPASKNVDEPFASLSEEGKMEVQTLPIQHKAYALLAIALSRFIIAVVVFLVGTNFLSMTNNLFDHILNSTALGFVIEVDNMIHSAFLGRPFSYAVTDQCEPVPHPDYRFRYRNSWLYLVVICFGIAAWILYLYNKPRGLYDIGLATQCLCHIEGKCLGPRLISSS